MFSYTFFVKWALVFSYAFFVKWVLVFSYAFFVKWALVFSYAFFVKWALVFSYAFFVKLRIFQSKCEKIRTGKSPYLDIFRAVNICQKWVNCTIINLQSTLKNASKS